MRGPYPLVPRDGAIRFPVISFLFLVLGYIAERIFLFRGLDRLFPLEIFHCFVHIHTHTSSTELFAEPIFPLMALVPPTCLITIYNMIPHAEPNAEIRARSSLRICGEGDR